MARPRVFVSSTYYDLKHIRHSLDIFIEGLGYDTILSEKGNIPYSHDRPLDISCYEEVNNVDIFVLIIGGRYGSEVSSTTDPKEKKEFYDNYESITKKEYETALEKDIPVYILIESNVYTEYGTYLKNKNNKDTRYAHVDSINIFHFIDEIVAKKIGNPIETFEKFDQIEQYLKEQWAGLFRDFINKKSEQKQIKTLTDEIEGLRELNKTLKKYMETILQSGKGDKSVIDSEDERLNYLKVKREIENNGYRKYLERNTAIDTDMFINIMKRAHTAEDFIKEIPESRRDTVTEDLLHFDALHYINDIRELLGLPPYKELRKKNND